MQIKMESKTCFSADCLRNKLYRDEEILLLDCRSNEEYRHGHIIDSHNIVLPQLMMRRLKANKLSLKSLVPPNFRQEKEAFLKKCMTHEVVLYDSHTFELTDNDTTMLCLLYNRLKAEGCNVFVLKNGYTKFESDHPEFCFKADNSNDADDEDFGSDESASTSPRGGRCSPVSPLTLVPSILGLGSLRISCEPLENDESNDVGFRLPVTNRPSRCLHHCDRFNSEGESDDPNSANSLSSGESGNSLKPAPLTIQHNCICHSNKNSACPSPAVNNHPSYGNAALPAEILPGLFLGCAKDASSAETLAQCNITYVLNVTPNLPNVFEKDPKYSYKQIPITDHWSQNLSQFFPEAIAFIDEARSKNCGVLVHCLAGISRSVTVTVAYLMQKLRWSLNDSYDFVKQRKSNVSPNFNFMGQLLDFEKTLGLGEYSEDDSSNPNAPSTPPTLFFTTTPPPTPTLTLPVMAQPVSALEVRTAFVLPTPRA